jgi:hypothetical protein
VPVDETLRVFGSSRIWALGDCAAVPNEATPGEKDPATCRHALRLAENLCGSPARLQLPDPRADGHARQPPRDRPVGGLPVKSVLGWLIDRG